MEKDNYAPLFVYANDPIAVYIINSEIVHLERSGEFRNTGGYASYLLCKLLMNKSLRAELPRKFMEKRADYLSLNPLSAPQPCLTGYLHEFNHCQCLGVRVDATEINNELFVKFSNFAMMNGYGAPTYTVDKFPGEFLLNPLDTFILLANLMVTEENSILFHEYSEDHKGLYRKYLRDNLINYFKNNKQGVFSKPFPFRASSKSTAFDLDYFEFLEQQLLSGKLAPYRILKHSGPMVINQLSAFMLKPEIINDFIDFTAAKLVNEYNSLSINNKVMFVTMHILADSFVYSYKSSMIQQHKKAVLKKVLKEYSKPFAKLPKGVEEDISVVWERYDLPFSSKSQIKLKKSK